MLSVLVFMAALMGCGHYHKATAELVGPYVGELVKPKDPPKKDACKGENACCYYWCPGARCECQDGAKVAVSQPDGGVQSE